MSNASPPFFQVPLRRAARAFSPAECLDILRRAEWGVLSLAAADGRPYGVPLNYALWEAGNAYPAALSRPRLIFHGAAEGLKLDLLSANPHACLTVVPVAEVRPEALSTRFESVMVFGAIRRLAPGDDGHDEALLRLGRRFSAAFPDALAATLKKSGRRSTVLVLEAQGMSGKFNPAR